MGWCLGNWSDTIGICPPGVKINAITYQELILEPVLQNLGQTMYNGEPFIFQQDGAPAHTANSTQIWLQHNFPGFIQKTEWPSYSPDLNLMDFAIWSILETNACAKSHTSVECLKRFLTSEWNKIPQESIRAAVGAFCGRLRAVVKKRGDERSNAMVKEQIAFVLRYADPDSNVQERVNGLATRRTDSSHHRTNNNAEEIRTRSYDRDLPGQG
ncbi:hypothetical protein LOD99_11004 [Oopsacas minuta]|uniref:Transposase n=1 Tax=Oopsacas minuta TaxID=111878 RepID=A0AAV7KDH4_9METZ|nr:hypothetical protein LOD99_11004 [Oopsacas minuta]